VIVEDRLRDLPGSGRRDEYQLLCRALESIDGVDGHLREPSCDLRHLRPERGDDAYRLAIHPRSDVLLDQPGDRRRLDRIRVAALCPLGVVKGDPAVESGR
jgi:hypothetical protein